jgi:hypothetical protein
VHKKLTYFKGGGNLGMNLPKRGTGREKNFEQKEREAITVVELGIINSGGFVDFVANLFGHGCDVGNNAGKIGQTYGERLGGMNN